MEGLVGGRFVIDREAGAGAMARVYLARDVTTDVPVALKILNGASEHTLRRFEREVAALAELTHPGVVGYVAHGRTATGQPFLAMEWLPGETLEARLHRGTLGVDETLALGKKLASALGAAHSRGLVHRDVKPANIFLLDGDLARPKLVDFGLTRDTLATFGLTGTGDLLGTPLYMAPEQASCDLDIDARCDVYALGAVLYTCLAGRAPILAPNLVGLLAKIVLEEPAPLTGVPANVARLVARMLAKKRDDRPANGVAAEAAIEDAGSQLSQKTSSPSLVVPSREQRVVSILLATHQIRQEAQLDATLAASGGVLGLADGSAMVVFAGPETPGDLAARAARLALGLRTTDGVVSLATGRAVLSGPMPMGEVIDRAAAQVSAAPGSVRVDSETAGLLEGRFELVIDPCGAELVGERAGELDSVRTLLGKPTRCIGRDRELAAIEGYFAECVGEGVARVLIVVADAGIGKSRLANEALRRLSTHSEAPEVVVARCESITEGSPFAAAAAALRRAAGITTDDTPARRAGRLAALLARHGSSDPQTTEFLGEILAIPSETPSERMRAARDNPSLMFDHIRSAWIEWLRNACERAPLVLVIEDLHWADESSVLLVDAALGALAEHRFMVLALARPEVRTRRPWTTRRPHELRLDPLAKRSSERLVRDALGPLATDEIVAGIIARAEGNALFLEELVRAAANPNVTALPVGVIGTLQLRFDSLRPESRGVLRIASVYGERFARTGLDALVLPAVDVGSALDELITAELVGKTADGFAFRHALVREAAYALLPDEDRKLAHRLAAELLVRENVHEPAVIARHFEIGQDLAEAARWYTTAAERALVHNDLAGALAHAQLAQRWTQDAGALGALDLLITEAEMWRGNMVLARDAGRRAATRLPTGSADWFTAAGLVVTATGQLGDNDDVAGWLARVFDLVPDADAIQAKILCLCRASSQLAWGDQTHLSRRALTEADALAHGQELGPMAHARVEFARAFDWLLDGRADACAATFAYISALYERIGARRDALQARIIGLATGMYAGVHQDARSALQECMRDAEQLEARYLVDWARFELGLASLIAGDREGAEAELARVPAALASTPLFIAGRASMSCWAAYLEEDIATIEAWLARIAVVPFSARHRAAFDAFAAYVRLRRGETAEARLDARRALVALTEAPGMAYEVQCVGFPVALATLVEAGVPDARELVEAYIARLEQTMGRWTDQAARDVSLTKLPWNKATYALRTRFS